MPRTTLNIDATVLRELQRRRAREDKPLGQIVSELLAGTLAADAGPSAADRLRWTARPMGARIDLEDKEALQSALDEP